VSLVLVAARPSHPTGRGTTLQRPQISTMPGSYPRLVAK